MDDTQVAILCVTGIIEALLAYGGMLFGLFEGERKYLEDEESQRMGLYKDESQEWPQIASPSKWGSL